MAAFPPLPYSLPLSLAACYIYFLNQPNESKNQLTNWLQQQWQQQWQWQHLMPLVRDSAAQNLLMPSLGKDRDRDRAWERAAANARNWVIYAPQLIALFVGQNVLDALLFAASKARCAALVKQVKCVACRLSTHTHTHWTCSYITHTHFASHT